MGSGKKGPRRTHLDSNQDTPPIPGHWVDAHTVPSGAVS